ncbi:MAG: hypothetical protein ABI207_03895 [Crocinitomicaceae bacterium]
MKKNLATILAIICCFSSFAQSNKNQKHFTSRSFQYPLYKWAGNFSRHGIQFSFGPTYMFTRPFNPTKSINQGTDSTFSYVQNPAGRLGAFIEIGMVHIAKKRGKIVHYFDWGIGYKQFFGVEKTTSSASVFGTTTASSGIGKFSLGYLYGRFDVHNITQIGKNIFIDNALGFNVDYRLVGKSSYTGTSIASTQHFQSNLVAQLNYNFGVGFKVREGFYVIPGFNIPFLGINDWNGGTPALRWFSSYYQPISASVKFIWLFKRDPNRCPPVYGGPDDKKLQDQLLNQ